MYCAVCLPKLGSLISAFDNQNIRGAVYRTDCIILHTFCLGTRAELLISLYNDQKSSSPVLEKMADSQFMLGSLQEPLNSKYERYCVKDAHGKSLMSECGASSLNEVGRACVA